jgi:hypothetical protein
VDNSTANDLLRRVKSADLGHRTNPLSREKAARLQAWSREDSSGVG